MSTRSKAATKTVAAKADEEKAPVKPVDDTAGDDAELSEFGAAKESADDDAAEPEEAPVGKAPAAAVVETPQRESYVGAVPSTDTPLDAAADRIARPEQDINITDEHGDPVSSEGLFEPVGPGLVVCNTRLIEHSTATPWQRPISRVLAGKGAVLSERASKVILNRLAGGEDVG